jgi:ABC-type multidrug transport system fused ATPase/permease subunit
MMETLRKILKLLTIDGRGGLFGLVIAITVMAVFDMVGVASIFPFLTVISNPEAVETNSKLKWIYDGFGFADRNSFFISLGMVTFIILVINNALRAGVMLTLLRFGWLKRYTISKRLFSHYLYEPYAFFLNRNSSELTTYLVTEITRVVTGVLIPCLQVLTRSVLALVILVLLFVIDPVVAIVVTVIIGGGYAIIYMFARKRLSRTGENLLRYSKKIFKVLNESFGGIKDIKLLGKEHVFIEQYADPMKKSIDCFCSQFLISQFPRYAFEILAFGGILFITIYIVVVKGDYHQVIPLVGLYAFAAYRLMPALQQIFQEFTLIRFNLPSLEAVYQDYINCANKVYEKQEGFKQTLSFSRNIKFRDLTFQYPKAQKPVIENLNLTIKANTTIGFVGGTGAGKTTVIDILLGLLRPQKGELIVDDIKVNEDNLRMWQKNIGYVPQNIYLCDDTISHNVAFGLKDEEVNQSAVEDAARLANIHDFIRMELPRGYETEVGERGVRLSGGQKQRIGIARALYHNPSLLVFDEATSALDGITEETILEAIHGLTHKKTIIIIAHRLSTVKECDVIYLIEQGRIVAQGMYQELLTNNQKFCRMAKVSGNDHSPLQSFVDASEKIDTK